MPKRQAKITHRIPKKTKQKSRFSLPSFSIPTFNVPLGFVFLFLFLALTLELFKTPYATANQIPSDSQMPTLYATALMTTPSPTPDMTIPLAENLEQSLQEQQEAASEAAGIVDEEYCIEVPVVTYHHIQPLDMAERLGHKVLTVDSVIFEDQISYLLENGYTALDVYDLVYALQNRTTLPEKSIIITIDDGYDDNYTYAFMLAKKYEVVMNFMIPTGLIGKSGYMQWEHLQELMDSPYASIYNHTTSHAPLGYITKDKIEEEIITANEQLAVNLGLENRIVTYPFGSYDTEAITTLQELGMTAAFTTDDGRKHCRSTMMRLPRIRIGNAPMQSYGF
jgi:peptidoglycan/xylan/chitin deacetylase (PgdA/CDA1 family)